MPRPEEDRGVSYPSRAGPDCSDDSSSQKEALMIGALILKKIVPAAFDAMNRHDLEASLKYYSDNATFVYPGAAHSAGTYTGKEAIRSWLKRFFEQFPMIRFEVKHVAVTNLFDITGSNVAAAHWEVHLTNREGLAAHIHGVTLITSRWGRAVRIQDFIFDTGETFRAAWGERKSKE
jgi:ketosteroid isomerase-like protein